MNDTDLSNMSTKALNDLAKTMNLDPKVYDSRADLEVAVRVATAEAAMKPVTETPGAVAEVDEDTREVKYKDGRVVIPKGYRFDGARYVKKGTI